MTDQRQDQNNCPRPAIGPYVDGELKPGEELELESHIAQCADCREELNLHKNMLRALDGSFTEPVVELPEDFTQRIVAAAESHVSGLEGRRERLTAFLIAGGLLLFAGLIAVGDPSRTLAPLAALGEKAAAFVGAAGHVVYDISLGFAIVFRTLISAIFFNSFASFAAAASFIAVILVLLSRVFLKRGGP